ncbi:hypothetical protein [Subtercola sp. RTI3]|uniref:hypothetical protein n=1 Tax=Subtercola sp. RTI3 TaxID=3048639 RepID=UPI002B22FFB9|nr:hypothetical protein [Subtercola sp. RTI3]MEA9985679.1 hypothetical protein [Subtercola sp. RTI3]
MTPDASPLVTDWISAIATAVTALVAIAAILYARAQLREASESRKQTKQLELDRNQPQVVVNMVSSDSSPTLVYLVIKNYGLTPARNVRLTIEPWPRESVFTKPGVTDGELVPLPEVIPLLAPGQDWRTFWDGGRERGKTELPDRHEGVASYDGIEGVSLTTPFILDWSTFKSLRWSDSKGISDVAKSLEKIEKNLKLFSEDSNGGLSVYVRDGDKKDATTEPPTIANFRFPPTNA